jgi:endonuclease III
VRYTPVLQEARVPVINDSWEPFQLKLKDEPFWMLVACVLVNRTRWEPNARLCFGDLRRLWPTPRDLAYAAELNVGLQVRELGFWKVRTSNLINLAATWIRAPEPDRFTVSDILCVPGCGKYAADSWAIFVEGRRDVEPTDKALRAYLGMP